MNLTTAEAVSSQIEIMKRAEEYRSPQRSLLNQFFNGDPPWTQQEAKDNQILINFNDKQGANLLHQARNQYENAFANQESFFRILLPDCKSDYASDWSDTITKNLNKALKNSRAYYFTLDEVFGDVVLHGAGVRLWQDDRAWRPYFVARGDLLIPTDTHLDMENLVYFAVRRKMRPGELFRKTFALGKNINPGWNTKLVRQLLDEYKDLNQNPNSYNWTEHPEQMSELFKQQSGGYYDSDIVPAIWFWDFYHLEEGLDKREPGWYRKMVLDRDCVVGRTGNPQDPVAFVYESKSPVASSLDQIAHFQFGDGNNVPPYTFHSIRSLAWLTYELVWTLNRLNCQFTQHLFEELMTFLRIIDPTDRSRLSKVVLTPPFAILPEGLNIVPAQERYAPRAELIESGMMQYRQRITDLTSTYTQELDSGSAKERTKFEVQALLAQTSALMGSMLGRAYRQEHFACREIARRFAIKNSSDLDVKKFRAACLVEGVPSAWLSFDRWEIEVEQVLGSGNRSMQVAEAGELFQNREAFDPTGQQEIKRDWVAAITNNPRKAARLAPLSEKSAISRSLRDAQHSFATLMQGVELKPEEGYNHTDQVKGVLSSMAVVIQRIMQTGGVGTPSEVIGLTACAKFIDEHLKLMAEDEKNAEIVKQFEDDKSKLMNLVKAFAQRQKQAAEKMAQGGNGGMPQGPSPESLAKAQAIIMQEGVKAKAREAGTRQKLQHKEQSFRQKQRLDDQAALAESRRKNLEMVTKISQQRIQRPGRQSDESA